MKNYDWFMGATAGGLILEAERLLIRHDRTAAAKRLPNLERVAAFLDTRRDPARNLLTAGQASNLLAPSYGGVHNPKNPTPGHGFLAEVSINYVAAVERLAEVCVLCKEPAKAKR